MDAPFDRERFEAEARAAAPPMPVDMTPAKDDLWDRSWFRTTVWVGGFVIVTAVGRLLAAVL